MNREPVLRMIDAVTVPVPDLERGLRFYRDELGHELLWRNDELGQAGLRLPDGETELVLSTRLEYAPNWLVASVDEAVESILAAGERSSPDRPRSRSVVWSSSPTPSPTPSS
jgi:catechol 2,3-dioxygenase-like lactoylglutathione lyase family enzyme